MAGTHAYLEALQRRHGQRLNEVYGQLSGAANAAALARSFTPTPYSSPGVSVGQPAQIAQPAQTAQTGPFDRWAGETFQDVMDKIADFESAVTGDDKEAIVQENMEGLNSPVTSNILNALATPLYGITNTATNVIDVAKGGAGTGNRRQTRKARVLAEELAEGNFGVLNAFNPIAQAYESWVGTTNPVEENGLTNQRKTGADVIDSLASNDYNGEESGYSWLRGFGGLGIDIFGDPLTYASGAGLLKAARVGSLTSKLGNTAGAAGKAADFSDLSRLARIKPQSRDFVSRYVQNWKDTGPASRYVRVGGRLKRNPDWHRNTIGRRTKWDGATDAEIEDAATTLDAATPAVIPEPEVVSPDITVPGAAVPETAVPETAVENPTFTPASLEPGQTPVIRAARAFRDDLPKVEGQKDATLLKLSEEELKAAPAKAYPKLVRYADIDLESIMPGAFEDVSYTTDKKFNPALVTDADKESFVSAMSDFFDHAVVVGAKNQDGSYEWFTPNDPRSGVGSGVTGGSEFGRDLSTAGSGLSIIWDTPNYTAQITGNGPNGLSDTRPISTFLGRDLTPEEQKIAEDVKEWIAGAGATGRVQNKPQALIDRLNAAIDEHAPTINKPLFRAVNNSANYNTNDIKPGEVIDMDVRSWAGNYADIEPYLGGAGDRTTVFTLKGSKKALNVSPMSQAEEYLVHGKFRVVEKTVGPNGETRITIVPETAASVDDIPVTPALEVPNKPLDESAVRKILDDNPDAADMPVKDLPAEVREAVDMTRTEATVDRSALNFESPFIRQLIEETTPGPKRALDVPDEGITAPKQSPEMRQWQQDREWAEEFLGQKHLFPFGNTRKALPFEEIGKRLSTLKTQNVPITAAQIKRWNELRSEQKRAREIMEAEPPAGAAESAATPEVVPEAQAAPEAATGGATQASVPTEQVARLTGAALNKWRGRLSRWAKKNSLTTEEYKSLLNARTEDAFAEALQKIRTGTPSQPFVGVPEPVEVVRVVNPERDMQAVADSIDIREPNDVFSERVMVGDDDITEIVNETLRKIIDTQFDPEFIKATYPHATNFGVPRTHSTPGVGAARYPRSINTPAQVKAYTEMWRALRERLAKLNIKFEVQDAIAMKQARIAMQALDERLISIGGRPFLGKTDKGPALSVSDVMGHLMEQPELYHILANTRFLAGTQQILDAVEFMLLSPGMKRNELLEEVQKILTADFKTGIHGKKPGVNRLMHIGETTGEKSYALRKLYLAELRANKHAYKPDSPERKFLSETKNKPSWGEIPNRLIEKFAQQFVARNVKNLTEAIVDNRKYFRTLSNTNMTKYGKNTINEAPLLSDEIIFDLVKWSRDPGLGMTKMLDDVVNAHTNLEEIAAEKGADAATREIAHELLDDDLTDVISPAEAVEVEHMVKVHKTGPDNPGKANREGVEKTKKDVAAAQLLQPVAIAASMDNVIETAQRVTVSDFFKGGRFRLIFSDKGLGAVAGLGDAIPNARSLIQAVMPPIYGKLNKLNADYGRMPSGVVDDAGNEISMFRAVSDALINRGDLSKFPDEAVNDIQAFQNMVFGNAKYNDSLASMYMDNFFLGNGINIKQANKVLEIRRAGWQFNRNRAAAMATRGEKYVRSAEKEARDKLAASKEYANKPVPQSAVEQKMAKKYKEWAAGADELKTKNFLSEQWRDALIPMNRFQKELPDYHQHYANNMSAISDITSEVAASRSLYLAMEKAGAVSKVPKPGWSRINPEGSIGAHLPGDAYFPDELLPHIAQVEALIADMYRTPNAALRWIQEYINPAQDMWKTGMTIYRPGHHFRNLIGDLSTMQLAGRLSSRTPRQTRDAIRIMNTMEGTSLKKQSIDAYHDTMADNAFSALKEGKTSVDGMPVESGTTITTLTLKGGRKVPLNSETIWNAMMDRGNFVPAHVRENLMTEVDDAATSGAQRSESWRQAITKKSPLKGQGREKAIRAAEVRDHTIRLTHFIAAIEKDARRYANLDELFDDAASEVRKYHPDGSGLTQVERDWARVLFPFYSWTRKAIPLIMESALIHPARFMAFPKASYAMATAQGQDLQGFGDPFPLDQLFPSFLRERALGPQFGNAQEGYWGINPGWANVDIMNTFAGAPLSEGPIEASPLRGVLGASSPILKVPTELAAGVSFGTGAPITDTSDYLDMQVPWLNSVNSITGFSPTAPTDVLRGDPVSWTSRAVEKGNKSRFNNPALYNFLFGLGVTDMSQESYQNLAEIELRNGRTYW